MSNNGWMPIESAPKDATWIVLGVVGRNEIMLGYWHRLFQAWWGQTSANGDFRQWQHATHWQPLPAPPTGEDA